MSVQYCNISNADARAHRSTPGDQQTGQTCITFTLLSPLSSYIVSDKRARPYAPHTVFLCALVSKAAYYRLVRLSPPTNATESADDLPWIITYRGDDSGPHSRTASQASVVRARSLVPRNSCDRTAPHHHHQSSYGHNIRCNSL